MQAKQNVLILGAGTFARSIGDMVEEDQGLNVAGFVVDMPPYVRGSKLADKPIYWIDDLEDFDKSHPVVSGLGVMARINLIKKVLEMGFGFSTLIHPRAYVSKTVRLGCGVIVISGAQIATDSVLGDHVIINRGALIGHNVTIKDYSFISPGANLASHVNIGARTTIGMGVNIIEHVTVGENCFVGAGSLLTQDVPDNVKVVGMPARIIERDIEND
jgi:acetyltransferase EpsM